MKVNYTLYLSIKLKGKFQFTYMWFDQNLNYLLGVWNLSLYPLSLAQLDFYNPHLLKIELNM